MSIGKKSSAFTTTSEGENENSFSFFPSAVGANAQRAFTLIELLVVIAIIGLLSSVVLASLSGVRERAQITRTVTDLKQIEIAFVAWMQATNRVQFPKDEFAPPAGDAETIEIMIEETTFHKYLQSSPDPQFGDNYYYDSEIGQEAGVCGESDDAIEIWEFPEDIAEEVDKIIDKEIDFNCGKVRYLDNKIRYVLSFDNTL